VRRSSRSTWRGKRFSMFASPSGFREALGCVVMRDWLLVQDFRSVPELRSGERLSVAGWLASYAIKINAWQRHGKRRAGKGSSVPETICR